MDLSGAVSWQVWVGFLAFVFLAISADLIWMHRRKSELAFWQALLVTSFWVGLAILFCLALWFWRGPVIALEFMTAYLLEQSLSVDNLFVFLLIFNSFKVPAAHQHRVLFWGILGAIVMRGVFIVAGVALITKFHWIIYVFGGFLVLTAIRMLIQEEKKDESELQEKNLVMRLVRKTIPTSTRYSGGSFFVREGGKILATPLLVVLVVVELSDVVFALDSIPAVLAVSRDSFVVYSSNIFAILGLRAMFFTLKGFMLRLHYLHYGLAAILAFVGLKMLLTDLFHIPIGISLGVVATILAVSLVASLAKNRRASRAR